MSAVAVALGVLALAGGVLSVRYARQAGRAYRRSIKAHVELAAIRARRVASTAVHPTDPAGGAR